MKSKYILVSLVISYAHFITLSNSSSIIENPTKTSSIIKNFPGFHGDLPFILETGYVGVGEDEQVQLFYYFVESQRNPSEDPLLLYLTGGPGTSALYSLLYQIGPLKFNAESSWHNNITLEMNQYSWTKAANIIFVDLPAGVGFSYAKTWEASRSSDSILAFQAYNFLRNWMMEHPKFIKNPLYISGISYMGIIIPIVTLEIYKDNEHGDQPQLNIKSTKETCHGNYAYNDAQNVLCANNLQRVDECTSGINLLNVLEPLCDATDMGPACQEDTTVFVDVWANNKDVQKALNVREGTIEKWEYTNTSIRYYLKKNDTVYYSYDIFTSIDYHKQLILKDCQFLIISGDHDMTFPYMGTEKWIATLNLPITIPWRPWFIHRQVAGYQMTYAQGGYSLTYATIKGAGHAVALYKPEEALIMVKGWLDSQNYSSSFYAQY